MSGKHPNRVRELRKAAGLNQTELGERVGMTYQEVSKLERGMRRLTTDMMVRLADALGVAPLAVVNAAAGKGAKPQGQAQIVDDADELALLALWRKLADGQRAATLRVIKANLDAIRRGDFD